MRGARFAAYTSDGARGEWRSRAKRGQRAGRMRRIAGDAGSGEMGVLAAGAVPPLSADVGARASPGLLPIAACDQPSSEYRAVRRSSLFWAAEQ